MVEKDKAALDAASKIRREDEKADIRWLLSEPQGRRIVWRLLAHAGVNRNPFDPDPYVGAFKAGQMNEGNWLYQEIIDAAPHLWVLMLKEQLVKTHEG